ncbi:hypothetical protein SAMN05660649_01591 [Desulfotomaculum arcticum]|uniref:Uncharacterized protein n=1 Tax=Desulfotruncus arcticus DSM 17038 TaxID=1121424 RepID=A0A1I2RJ18_9FIRM|nr:hypothetical protein [Desulfotruncus arcticus]SFG40674.1 hypothetical protein SAMN05660649_01591 [Desulfotomaculum arcticum] [Desulfotruncus arcticus DSM 17038]
MAPLAKGKEEICLECTLCSFYWGESCPGINSYTIEDCIELGK